MDDFTMGVADIGTDACVVGIDRSPRKDGPGGGSWQFTRKRCVVRVYWAGGGAEDQKTGRGSTVVGAAENTPTAMS
ncbi:MAG: hypothetical protein WCB11_17105 [Terriglobales bacterium]